MKGNKRKKKRKRKSRKERKKKRMMRCAMISFGLIQWQNKIYRLQFSYPNAPEDPPRTVTVDEPPVRGVYVKRGAYFLPGGISQ